MRCALRTLPFEREVHLPPYVVAAVDYRKGWNPNEAITDDRTESILRAVYRGLQDAKTCVRYFRKDVATNNNSYGIDDTRIAVGGQGSGGYISLAFGALDKLSEIQLQKFYNFSSNEYTAFGTAIHDV